MNCPHCNQNNDPAHKSLNLTLLRPLRALVEHSLAAPANQQEIHLGSFVARMIRDDGSRWVRDNSIASLRLWGLLEEVPKPSWFTGKAKGSRGHTGWWKVTDKAFDFFDGKITLPKKCVWMKGHPDDLVFEGDQITFSDGEKDRGHSA